jgi:2-dehydro-3-deoxyphosphooctonate aldolase (KDO 8-P synthase)
MATALKKLATRRKIGFVYKTSFDKANRTSDKSARGPRLDHALGIFPKSANASACRADRRA